MTFVRLILCFIWISVGIAHAAVGDLSNRLPVSFVEELMQEQLWSQEFEDSSRPSAQELSQFWSALQDKNQSPKNLAEKFFQGQKDFHDQSSLYQIKVMELRWMKNNDKSNQSRWLQVEKALLDKYLQMTLSLIKLTEVVEYDVIALNTRRVLDAGELRLIDLSPQARLQLAKTTNPLHPHLAQLVLQKNDKIYVVNALLQSNSGVLAIDLKRSVAENVVTIAHEIVHLGDGELLNEKSKLEQLYPKVLAKLQTLLPPQKNKLEIAQSLLMDVYHEMGREDAIEVVQRLRDRRLESLTKSFAENVNFNELLKDPELSQWSESLIKVTLGNEVKAYILSLVVYRKLYSSMNLIPFSFEREKFITSLQSNNFNFALSISSALNPFNRQTFLAQQVDSAQNDLHFTNSINQIKALLETHYLTATKKYIQSMTQVYAKALTFLEQSKSSSGEGADESFLPEWTKKDKFDSPLNPYTILTAKISTAWVLRFKQGAKQFIENLQNMNESLLTLKAGILDLHDLNFGELQMLGLHAANSNAQYLPRDLDAKLRGDLGAQPQFLVNYFKDTQWVPINFGDRPVIEQTALVSNLIRLRLLKALYWLETGFPTSQEHLTAVKTFKLKLREGLYDKEELATDRVAELELELDKAMNIASSSGYEMNDFGILIESLVSYYEIAREEKWITVANEFSRKLTGAKTVLTNMGLESLVSDHAHKEKISLELNSLRSQIDKEYEFCKAQKEMIFVPGGQKFNLRQASFPLTAICYDQQLYVFRQPGDFTRSATTLIKDGRPESRIFIGARPVRLNAFINYKNRGIKWFWQNN